MATFVERLVRAHLRSVPLLAVTTADPRATIRAVAEALEGHGSSPPVIVAWDVIQGPVGVNEAGAGWLRTAAADSRDADDDLAGFPPEEPRTEAVAFLTQIQELPSRSVAFLHNAHRFVTETGDGPRVTQAVTNLRDRFKRDLRTLILLAPDIRLPAELREDVLILDQPLPDRDQLADIVDAAHTFRAGGEVVRVELDPEHRQRAVDCVTGLSAFGAEQLMALTMTRDGCDIEELRRLRHRTIEQTPGLTIYKGGESYKDVGGIDYAKDFFGRVLCSRRSPRAIVYVDEIEKALAGAGRRGGDTSGVSQDILGTLLSFMEDHRANGTICFGPPGCSKSLIAKATGNQGGIDTIQLDLGALKGSLVGQSERNIRLALRVVEAVSAGRSYWIATCNSLGELPPPLIRRFTHGILFFDLPDAEEREAIWRVHVAAYGLTADQSREKPAAEAWSGADIRNCCELAHEFDVSLKEASSHLVPVAVSDPDLIASLRRQARGRYKSASTGRPYGLPSPEAPARAGRTLDIEPELAGATS